MVLNPSLQLAISFVPTLLIHIRPVLNSFKTSQLICSANQLKVLNECNIGLVWADVLCVQENLDPLFFIATS